MGSHSLANEYRFGEIYFDHSPLLIPCEVGIGLTQTPSILQLNLEHFHGTGNYHLAHSSSTSSYHLHLQILLLPVGTGVRMILQSQASPVVPPCPIYSSLVVGTFQAWYLASFPLSATHPAQ